MQHVWYLRTFLVQWSAIDDFSEQKGLIMAIFCFTDFLIAHYS